MSTATETTETCTLPRFQRTPPLAILLAFAGLGWLASPPAADAQGATPIYRWHQDEHAGQRILMGSTKEWFCGIYSVQGDFRGVSERVEIGITEAGQWYLSGKSGRGDVQIEALCFPYNSAGSGLKVHSWKRGQAPVTMGSANNQLCALTSVGGDFAGHREFVRVYNKNNQWMLDGDSDNKHIEATAACIEIRFRDTTFTDWKQGSPAVRLTPASSSLCFLNLQAGQFNGWGERIELSIVGGFWQVGGKSNQSAVATKATCLTF